MNKQEKPKDTGDNSLGKKIATERGEKGWSQRELADEAGVSNTTINRIERGKINPSSDVIKKVARALDMSLDDLMYNDRGTTQKLREIENSLEEKAKVKARLFNRKSPDEYSTAMKKDLIEYLGKLEENLEG